MKRLFVGIILVGAILLLSGGLAFNNGQAAQLNARQGPKHQISLMEPDSSIWGEYFPDQYASFLLTEDNNTATTYGGSDPYSKLEADPRLLTLFAGYGFSIEYNEDRGHMWTKEDVEEIDRVNATTHATCYSCKSANNPQLWAEIGMEAYDAMLFSEMTPNINFDIGCANCHDADSMHLVVTNPAFANALTAQGIDWTTFTQEEMRTMVCGNCHVEYYFQGPDKILVFPWSNGTRIDQIIAYYNAAGYTDWTHPDSGAPVLKAQHPEFETFTAGSTHYEAGVSCADCHMPTETGKGPQYTDHNIKSPLFDLEAACHSCHTDIDFLTTRINLIQLQTYTVLINTEEALLDAIAQIEISAATPGADATLIAQARSLHREAQMYWDFVAAENSMGFHNPEYTLSNLAHATNIARQAQLAALQALP
jgi:nitrite reductase (cytochrome c-552)